MYSVFCLHDSLCSIYSVSFSSCALHWPRSVTAPAAILAGTTGSTPEEHWLHCRDIAPFFSTTSSMPGQRHRYQRVISEESPRLAWPYLQHWPCGWTKNGWVAVGWERFEPKLLQSYCNSSGDIRLGATKVSSDFKECTYCYVYKCCWMGPAFLKSGLWNPCVFPMGFCSGLN